MSCDLVESKVFGVWQTNWC